MQQLRPFCLWLLGESGRLAHTHTHRLCTNDAGVSSNAIMINKICIMNSITLIFTFSMQSRTYAMRARSRDGDAPTRNLFYFCGDGGANSMGREFTALNCNECHFRSREHAVNNYLFIELVQQTINACVCVCVRAHGVQTPTQ